MSQNIEEFRNSIPVGDLGIIPLQSCSELGNMVNEYIVDWRKERESVLHQDDKIKDSYIVNTKCSRFGSGEAKGTILDSIRGKDLYLLVDVTNYSIEYSLCGHMNKMSPDDHYSDLKRIITAAAGKARRINVIMPFLYESRQHKRTARESLDCAVALGVAHSEQAAKVQREVSDFTNEMLKKNAERLKTVSVNVAKESERGIVDIETLQTTNEQLISTLDEVLQIQKDGRAKRQAAEVELQKIEGDLKAKLLSMRSSVQG